MSEKSALAGAIVEVTPDFAVLPTHQVTHPPLKEGVENLEFCLQLKHANDRRFILTICIHDRPGSSNQIISTEFEHVISLDVPDKTPITVSIPGTLLIDSSRPDEGDAVDMIEMIDILSAAVANYAKLAIKQDEGQWVIGFTCKEFGVRREATELLVGAQIAALRGYMNI